MRKIVASILRRVDRSGVNAFFINKAQFDGLPQFFNGLEFGENFALQARFRNTGKEQFEQIKDMRFYDI